MMKQTLVYLKGETRSHIIILEDFSTILTDGQITQTLQTNKEASVKVYCRPNDLMESYSAHLAMGPSTSSQHFLYNRSYTRTQS